MEETIPVFFISKEKLAQGTEGGFQQCHDENVLCSYVGELIPKRCIIGEVCLQYLPL